MSQDVQTAESEEKQTPLFYFLQIAGCHMCRFPPVLLIFRNLLEHIDCPLDSHTVSISAAGARFLLKINVGAKVGDQGYV